MIRKRKLTIFISLALFAVLLVVYVAVIAPMLETPEEVKEPLVTVDSIELEGLNGRFMLFEHLERAEISSISVTNAYGGYKFIKNDDGAFEIDGHPTSLFDATMFSQLVVNVGYTLAKEKICDYATDEQFAQYGLDVPQGSWTVESVGGKKYTVEVGDELITGAGYYCRFVGRDSIYVLDSTIGTTVLAPIEEFVSPVLTAGISSENYYMIDNFTIFRGEDIYFASRIKPKNSQDNPDAEQEFEIIYPANYEPDSTRYPNLLHNMVDLSGFAVASLGFDDEDLEKYGLTVPAYTIRFELDGVDIMIMVSEKQEDGSYFAMSSLFPDTIVWCYGDTFAFLEQDLIEWISSYIFQSNISLIYGITIKSDKVDIKFDLDHGVTDSGVATLDVTTSVGKYIDNANIYNFRQLYKVLLSVQMVDYAPFTEEEVKNIVENDEPYMTIAYKNGSGKETTYRFYEYSTRRALVTINGKGQFYIYTDILDKIANDVNRVLNDEDIDPYGKN